MIPFVMAVWVALSPPSPDPGLPTPPPALPTYIVNADGTHTECSPNYTSCDWK